MSVAILADFLQIKKSLGQQVFMSLICGAIIGLACGNVAIVPPLVMFLVAIGQGFSLVALDERNGWESYRCSLPMSRGDLIKGRMTFVVLLAVAFLAIGLAISVVLTLVAPALTGVGFLNAAEVHLDATELAVSAVSSLAAILIMLGICFPMIAKFGMTRAVRMLPLVFVLIFLGVIVFFGGTNSANLVALDTFLNQFPFVLVGGAFLVVGIAVFVVGSVFAARFYEAREF